MTKYSFDILIDNHPLKVEHVVNPRLKHTNIRVYRDRLYISNNVRISTEEILKFIETNKKKIIAIITRPKIEKLNQLHLWGNKYSLDLVLSNKNKYLIEDNKITIYYTKEDNIKNVIRKMYKDELSKIDIFSMYQDIIKIYPSDKYNNVVISDKYNYYKTFLGRYFVKSKKIEISSYIAKYDKREVYHVLCHEISHIFVASHSEEFYKVLYMFDNNYKLSKARRKNLNKEIRSDYI